MRSNKQYKYSLPFQDCKHFLNLVGLKILQFTLQFLLRQTKLCWVFLASYET